MYLANLRGMWKFWQSNPQFGSIAVNSLWHQTLHRLRNGKNDGGSHPPELISVFVTDRCNMRCRECQYAHSETPGYQLNQDGDMDPIIYRKLINETQGNPMVSFTGGEPLLHDNIVDFIAYAKARGRFCALVTNGWFLPKKAAAICEAGLDLISISLNGPEDVHDKYRRYGSFQRLLDGVECLLRQSKRPLIVITMAITDANFKFLIPTYELAKLLGVDGFNVSHLWMQTEDMVVSYNAQLLLNTADLVAWKVLPEMVDPKIVADGLKNIRQRNWGSKFLLSEAPYLNRSEIEAWYRYPELPVKYKTVRCGWNRIKVWPDGKVKPCRDWEVGDISRHM